MKRLALGIFAAACMAAAACSDKSSTTAPSTPSLFAGSLWVFSQGTCAWGPFVVTSSGTFASSNGACGAIDDNIVTGSISASGNVTGTQAFQGGSTFTLTGTCTTTTQCSGTVSGGTNTSWTMVQ